MSFPKSITDHSEAKQTDHSRHSIENCCNLKINNKIKAFRTMLNTKDASGGEKKNLKLN